MVESGRVILHMVNSSGRESSVDLIGAAFALPCLCYSEKGWRRASARLTFIVISCEIEKWMTNFHPASQRTGPGPYIWPLMLMLMQLTIDAVHWSATYMADGKRAKAILKN